MDICKMEKIEIVNVVGVLYNIKYIDNSIHIL